MNETISTIEIGEPGQILTLNDEGMFVWVDLSATKTKDYPGEMDFSQKMQSISRILSNL